VKPAGRLAALRRLSSPRGGAHCPSHVLSLALIDCVYAVGDDLGVRGSASMAAPLSLVSPVVCLQPPSPGMAPDAGPSSEGVLPKYWVNYTGATTTSCVGRGRGVNPW
jgi:hypothetical protein